MRLSPFAFSAPQSSSFRFDRRLDYMPIDAGFSPNRHDGITMVGYPSSNCLQPTACATPARLESTA
ncbi:hypothetical protein DDV93_12530 [Cereibacter johrii]|nr:hypothetical protein DDV93_12530 [Cereibacter johrii]